MAQLVLFETDQKRFRRWKEFHRRNPAIWKLFKEFAVRVLEVSEATEKCGARFIGERIRYDLRTEPKFFQYRKYKINDHCWPYYARLLAGTDSRFRHFFTFKNERFDATVEQIVAFHNGLN